jgi:hypothetical protein
MIIDTPAYTSQENEAARRQARATGSDGERQSTAERGRHPEPALEPEVLSKDQNAEECGRNDLEVEPQGHRARRGHAQSQQQEDGSNDAAGGYGAGKSQAIAAIRSRWQTKSSASER